MSNWTISIHFILFIQKKIGQQKTNQKIIQNTCCRRNRPMHLHFFHRFSSDRNWKPSGWSAGPWEGISALLAAANDPNREMANLFTLRIVDASLRPNKSNLTLDMWHTFESEGLSWFQDAVPAMCCIPCLFPTKNKLQFCCLQYLIQNLLGDLSGENL